LASARNAVARARALEPNLPERCQRQAEIQLAVDFDWAGATETLRQARQLAPADPDLLVLASQLARSQGELQTANDLLRQAVALDPVKPAALAVLAFNLVLTRHFEEARELYRPGPGSESDYSWAYAGPGLGYLLDGKYDRR